VDTKLGGRDFGKRPLGRPRTKCENDRTGPIVAAEWLALLLCIQESPGSNIGTFRGHSDWVYFVVFLSASSKLPG
jgi:hypothetical protein